MGMVLATLVSPYDPYAPSSTSSIPHFHPPHHDERDGAVSFTHKETTRLVIDPTHS